MGFERNLKVRLGPQDFWPKLSLSLVDTYQKVTRLVSLDTPMPVTEFHEQAVRRSRLIHSSEAVREPSSSAVRAADASWNPLALHHASADNSGHDQP